MIPLIFSWHLETGIVDQANPTDDTYIDYHLPGGNADSDFTAAAFGTFVRAELDDIQLDLGVRSLGSYHLEGNLIDDDTYLSCRFHPVTCPKPTQRWISGGSEAQAYASVGYRFHLGSFSLIPSLGVGYTRIDWHADITTPNFHEHIESPRQYRWLPFGGLTLEKGRFGIGLYLLDTSPDRPITEWYPGEGHHAGYLRVTWRVL